MKWFCALVLVACSTTKDVSSTDLALMTSESLVVPSTSAEEGSTYVLPGEVVFTGRGDQGFVELCHYPDEFLMSTGGFLAKSGIRGFRAADPTGQTAIIVGAVQEYGFVSTVPPSGSTAPRDLWLYASGDLRLNATEQPGYLEMILNGRRILIPFIEAP